MKLPQSFKRILGFPGNFIENSWKSVTLFIAEANDVIIASQIAFNEEFGISFNEITLKCLKIQRKFGENWKYLNTLGETKERPALKGGPHATNN